MRAAVRYEIVAHGAAGRTVFFVDGARVGAAAAAAAAEVDGAGNVPLPRKPGPSDRKQVFGRVIHVRFNMSVPRARVPEKASTRRERSER